MEIEKALNDGHDFLDLISILEQNNILTSINDIIDIGCGEGTILFKYLKKNYTALEKDFELESSISQKLSSIDGEHEIIISDFLEVKINNQFDIVILNNVLTEIAIKNFDKILKKCRKILRTNGFIFLRANSEFHSDIKKARNETEFKVDEISKNKFYIESNNYIKNYFTKKELIDLLEKNGFTAQVIKRIDEDYLRTNEIKSEIIVIGTKYDA